jgi:molybdenum cofactor guanylyltransferase
VGGLAALVLAGGAATRMGGGDKPLLRLGALTLLEHVLAALRSETARIAISANGDPARLAAFGLPVLPDGRFAGEGPLAGLLAGLGWAMGEGADALLTVPGDTPFIPAGLAASLAPAPACAARDGRVHHLVALWPVAARDALDTWLATTPSRAVGRFAAGIGMRVVDFPAAGPDPFLNINTPAELDAARRLVERGA